MLQLAIETSSLRGTLALSDRGGVVREASFPEGLVHGREIAYRLGLLLGECGAGPRDLDGIAVGLGPGSYTGIRVGVTAAKTLGLALRVPVVGLSSFDVLASGARLADHRPEEGERSVLVLPVLDARHGLFYGAAFRLGDGDECSPGGPWPARAGPDEVARPAELVSRLDGPALVFGEGADGFLEATRGLAGAPGRTRGPRSWDLPRAAVLAARAAELVEEAAFDPEAVHRLSPSYLRPSEPELRRARREAETRRQSSRAAVRRGGGG